MAANEDRPLVGSRYRLSRPIGSGGMGQVWEADDTVLQRGVAIKAVDLPLHLDDDDRRSLRSRVLREARAAARIDHPASVRVFDVVEDGDRLYVVMELVRAPTLAEVVDQRGPLPVDTAASVGLGLLGALEAAHGAGIVHRDVKPANVMMLDDGGVKLADFGIASVKDDTRITAAGLVLGTPSYMAPEQAAGRPVGAPADLWGLGALLYYAVEGVPPFERGEPLPTLNAVVHDEPRPMERADGLAPAVTALLSKEPDARPTAAECRASLEGVARRQGVGTAAAPASSGRTAVMPAAATSVADDRAREAPASPPPSAPYRPPVRTGRSGGGWGWLAGLGVVCVVALLAGLALANADGDDPAPAADQTVPTSPSTAPEADGSGDASPPPETTPTTARQAPSTTASGPRPEGVPQGWVRHTDSATGYTIWHPPSWSPQGSGGSSTDFIDAATGDYLRVDYVTSPGDDPVEAWEDQSERFRARYGDGYEEIRIEPTEYQGFDAAIWEYTYQGQHATNLGFVTDDYGFALNFQTAEARWRDRQDIRRAFEAGFRPPG